MSENNNASVVGVPDPNFKPDPRERQVYDEDKGVFRTVRDDDTDEKPVTN